MALTLTNVNMPGNAWAVQFDLSKTGDSATITLTKPSIQNTNMYFNVFGLVNGIWQMISGSNVGVVAGSNTSFTYSKPSGSPYATFAIAPMVNYNTVPTNSGWWTSGLASGPSGATMSGYRLMTGGLQSPDTSITINLTVSGGGGMD